MYLQIFCDYSTNVSNFTNRTVTLRKLHLYIRASLTEPTIGNTEILGFNLQRKYVYLQVNNNKKYICTHLY